MSVEHLLAEYKDRLSAKDAEIARLKAELAEYQSKYAEALGAYQGVDEVNRELEAANKRLRDGLRKYAEHQWNCTCSNYDIVHKADCEECDCGLAALLKEGEK